MPCSANQAFVSTSSVPDLLAAFLALPITDVIGEDHLTEIGAYLARRVAISTLDSMVEGYLYEARKSHGNADDAAPEGLLGRILNECAPVHRKVRTPRAKPPFDYFVESSDLSSVEELERLHNEKLEAVASLVVRAHALRVKLWHFGVSDGPFSNLLGEVDVRWRGEWKESFELPEWSGSLTTTARIRFEQNVDLTSAETRMRQLFEDGEGIKREARYLYRIEELSKLFQIVNKRYVPLKYRLYI